MGCGHISIRGGCTIEVPRHVERKGKPEDLIRKPTDEKGQKIPNIVMKTFFYLHCDLGDQKHPHPYSGRRRACFTAQTHTKANSKGMKFVNDPYCFFVSN